MKKTLLSIFILLACAGTAFAQSVSNLTGTYTGQVYISMEPINDETEAINGTVELSSADVKNGVNFKLPNFSFSGMNLGDIELNDLVLQFKGNYATFQAKEAVQMIFLKGEENEIHANVSVDTKLSYIRGEKVQVELPVVWTNAPGGVEAPIYVRFVGTRDAQPAQMGVKEIAGTYGGDLYLSLGEPITADMEPMPNQKVVLSESGDGKVKFLLPDFNFETMTLGDIEISDIDITFSGTTAKFGEKAPVSLVFNPGTETEIKATAQIDVDLSSIWGDAIDVALNVMWVENGMGEDIPIYVRFIGKNQTTGINDVTVARPAAQGVYTIDGRYVGKTLDNVNAKGVYIVGGKKVVK